MVAVVALLFLAGNNTANFSGQPAQSIDGYDSNIMSKAQRTEPPINDPEFSSTIDSLYKSGIDGNTSEVNIPPAGSTDVIVFWGCPGGYIWSYFGGAWNFWDGSSWFATAYTSVPTIGCMHSALFGPGGRLVMQFY